MKKILAITLALLMMATITGCGQNAQSTVGVIENAEVPVDDGATQQAESISVGNKISVGFAEITIEEANIMPDIKRSIDTGNITYTTGPDPAEGKEFVYIRGKIKNIGKSVIDSFEIKGTAEIDGYSYDADDIDVIESDGKWTYSLDPLVEYEYTLSAEVPAELLASGKPCTFNFGFNELFDYMSEGFEGAEYKYTMQITKN